MLPLADPVRLPLTGDPLPLGAGPPVVVRQRTVAAVEQEMAVRPHPAADRRLAVRHRADLVDARSAADAARSIAELPGPDAAVHLLVSGRFALWDIVPAAADLAGCRIDRLHVATLGFSKRNVEAMARMLDAGTAASVRLLCSHYFAGTSPAIYQFAVDELAARPGGELLSLRTHCKLLMFAFADGRRLTVESSANLRSCKNIEQATLFGSPDVHAFHAAWVDEMFARGADFINAYTGQRAAP